MQGYYDVESTVDADPSPTGTPDVSLQGHRDEFNRARAVELDEESMFGFAHADGTDALQQQRKTSNVILALERLGITLACAVNEVPRPPSYSASFISDAVALLKLAKGNALLQRELVVTHEDGESSNQLTQPVIPTQVFLHRLAEAIDVGDLHETPDFSATSTAAVAPIQLPCDRPTILDASKHYTLNELQNVVFVVLASVILERLLLRVDIPAEFQELASEARLGLASLLRVQRTEVTNSPFYVFRGFIRKRGFPGPEIPIMLL